MRRWELSHVATHTVPVQAKRVYQTQDQVIDGLMAKNPFHALSEDRHEEDKAPVSPPRAADYVHENSTRRTWKAKAFTEPGITTMASLSEYPWMTKVSQGTRKRWKRQLATMPPIVEEAEL